MIQQSDLTEARLWDESVCLDCGTIDDVEVTVCSECGSTDVFHVSTIDTILAKVTKTWEGEES